MPNMLTQAQADAIVALTKEVGKKVRVMLKEPMTIEQKADGSKVTSIDLEAHNLLCAGLQKIAPGIQILSEEDESNHYTFDRSKPFFTLDPIDGTSQLIRYAKGEKDRVGFSVMVGLIEDGVPTFGAVNYPAMGESGTTYSTNAACNRLYEQVGDTTRKELNGLRAMPCTGKKKALLLSVPENETITLGNVTLEVEPSSALDRMLRLVKGEAYMAYNNYTQYPPGYWDLAPFQAMFKAAGGALLAFSATQQHENFPKDISDGQPMRYDGSHDATNIKSGPYLRKSIAASPATFEILGNKLLSAIQLG